MPFRGLWYDKLYGNLLKVDSYGNILTVVHGFKFLNGYVDERRRERQRRTRACASLRHEVRQIYPNKYITVDDRIYVFYTLFNLPGKRFEERKSTNDMLAGTLEIYLIACLVDYFSSVANYVEYVGEELHRVSARAVFDDRDRTGVIYGQNILSFRAIFNDVRNSVDRVHQRVHDLLPFVELCILRLVSGSTEGSRLREHRKIRA